MIDIIGKRYIFFLISLIIIIPGISILIILSINGNLPVSIDFKGGSLVEVALATDISNPSETFFQIYDQIGITDPQVQTTNQGTVIIRSSYLDDTQRSNLRDELNKEFSTDVNILRFENVGPTISKEVTTRAAIAVSVAALIVVVYITLAFRGIQNAFRYGICAVIAMVHDVAIVLSITGFGALFLGWQIDALFLTALLTVIGFSVQDKIVVFDRIRENSGIYKKLDFEMLVNHSVVQTLQRSINTQLMTVEFILLSLALFGGITLREFSLILLIGLVSGTYSSIFTAAPLLVVWNNKEWRKLFKKNQSVAA